MRLIILTALTLVLVILARVVAKDPIAAARNSR